MPDRVTDYRRALGRWALQNPAASSEPGTLSAYADQLLTMGDDELASLATAPQSFGPGGATQDPNKLITLAKAEKGKRYAGPIIGESQAARWGDPGWDCSSFVSGMYRQLGIQITPFTDTAASETARIDPTEAMPGDIIFFQYKDNAQSGVKYPHMGLYLGNGQMIDASYGRGVTERPIPQNLGTVEFHRAKGAEAFLQPEPQPQQVARAGLGFDPSQLTNLFPGGAGMESLGGLFGPRSRTMEYNEARDKPRGVGPFGMDYIPNAPLGGNPMQNRELFQQPGDLDLGIGGTSRTTPPGRGGPGGDLQTGIGGTAATGLYRGERAFNPNTDKPQSFEEAAAFAADVAKNAGLGPEATKALIAIMAQEGGWGGRSGDFDQNGQAHSFGALHFNDRGQLLNFARSMNMDPRQAAQLLQRAPMAGLDWAVRNYLGTPLRAAEDQGLAGPEVVAAGIRGGQNPQADPGAYIGQYNRLFGQGQAIPTMGGMATAAAATPRVGLPAITAEDLSSAENVWGAIGNTLLMADELIAGIPQDDPNYTGPTAEDIRAATTTQIKLLQWAQERGDTQGYQAVTAALARERLGLEERGLQRQIGKDANDYRLELMKLTQNDQQWSQKYGLDVRKFLETELPQSAMALRSAESQITGYDPVTGMQIPAMQQWTAEFPLREAALTGEYQGQQTLGARTLEEEMMKNQEALRMGFSNLQTQQAEAMEKAQREAEMNKLQLAQYALPEGTEYVPGLGPGGTGSKIAGMLGTNFAPTPYRPTNINPGIGLEELRTAFGNALGGWPQRR